MKTRIYLLSLITIFSFNITSAQVVLNYFTGNQSAGSIDLSWQSNIEYNLDHYAVERSIDSINYFSVQNFVANGTTSAMTNYNFSDTYLFSDTSYYYRLKITTFDGNYEYSDTIKVVFNSSVTSTSQLVDNLTFSIYPNPVTNGQLIVQLVDNGNYTLQVLNQVGQNVFTKESSSAFEVIDCSKFISGLYYIQYVTNNGQQYIQKFIVE